MDKLLYNIFAYKTDLLFNNSAIIIQRAYKNYKTFQIKRRIDIIKNLIPNKKDNIELENTEELTYWNNMRKIIKSDKEWVIL